MNDVIKKIVERARIVLLICVHRELNGRSVKALYLAVLRGKRPKRK